MAGNSSRSPCRLRSIFSHLGATYPFRQESPRLPSSTLCLGPLDPFHQRKERLDLKGEGYRVHSKAADCAPLLSRNQCEQMSPCCCPCDRMTALPPGSWLREKSQQWLPHFTLRKPSGSKHPETHVWGEDCLKFRAHPTNSSFLVIDNPPLPDFSSTRLAVYHMMKPSPPARWESPVSCIPSTGWVLCYASSS